MCWEYTGLLSGTNPNGKDYQQMIVDATPEIWESSGFTGEKLSLDDIFIACVGMATTRI